MMIDENLARLRAHRNNIGRYRRLCRPTLRCLSATSSKGVSPEEDAALNRVASYTFPLVATLPDMRAPEVA